MEIGRRKKGPVTAKQAIDNKIASETPSATTFPSDLAGHQLVMNFVKYSFSPDGATTENTTGTIAFPIPTTGMVDKTAINYNASELGVVGAAVASSAGVVMDAFSGAGKNTEPKKIDYEGAVKGLFAGGAAFARESIPDQFGDGISQGLGNIANPHIALLFKGMALKTFSFNWTFAPRSQAESDTLKRIIQDIKKKIHPKYTQEGANFFLNYPDEVDLYYAGSGDYLHYFKRAAVTDMEVNYQSQGTAFLAGGAPAFVEISMSFQETEIWTAEDFE